MFSESHVSDIPAHFVMERHGRLSEMDRKFDVEYWQRLGPEAIFEAAWQMVVGAHSRQPGGLDALRLRRTVEHFQRARS
jgi:hypothetical protein